MRRNLLFVTRGDDDSVDGLSYALDLAKMTDKGISILLIEKKSLSEKFDDVMTAITFAEANDHDTARRTMKAGGAEADGGFSITDTLKEMCRRSGFVVDVSAALQDTASALQDFLKRHTGIDMILLSPSITENGNISSRELNKLVRTVSRPIVTLAKHAQATS